MEFLACTLNCTTSYLIPFSREITPGSRYRSCNSQHLSLIERCRAGYLTGLGTLQAQFCLRQ